MATWRSSQPMLAAICFVCVWVHSSGLDYVRPPPRRIISTSHNGSKAHPQQIHISVVGKDYMKISWITDDKSVSSLVEYGTSPGSYESSATGEQTSYHFFFYTSGHIHNVKIGPLTPNTVYYYRCGGIDEEFSFKTTPETFPIEFVVVGDLGQTEWTASTLAHIKKWDYDLLLLPGDLSYADNQQPLWDSFGRLVSPLARSRPWMVTEGNHEVEKVPIIGPPAFRSYNARWPMPFEESGSTSNLYYSFEVAGAHIIMLGSYSDFDSKSAQYKWLKKDLAAVNRTRTPWLIVLIHAPWYNTNLAHQGEGEEMRKAMEELIYKTGVDIVFAGHVHAYERFTRVYDNKANPHAPIHITIGDGGNREGLAMLFKTPASPLSLLREASFGHGRLKLVNQTHAHWSWHRNEDDNSVIGDEVWLESLSEAGAFKGVDGEESSAQARDEL
ncbi:purple acid phosphatase 22-like [Aristolochia californica]|uniref:purple acid phosphatase 22-like n=1 Tax=Aristolochia californica TaxID=171875 RepID=UPI0035D632DC